MDDDVRVTARYVSASSRVAGTPALQCDYSCHLHIFQCPQRPRSSSPLALCDPSPPCLATPPLLPLPHLRLNVNEGEELEYKFCIVKDGAIARWEGKGSGANRKCKVSGDMLSSGLKDKPPSFGGGGGGGGGGGVCVCVCVCVCV